MNWIRNESREIATEPLTLWDLAINNCTQLSSESRRNGQISRNINLPKRNKEEVESKTKPLTSNEIETVIKSLCKMDL